MIAMNGSSLGRTAGPVRRYPGATACSSIFATVLRSIPNWRAAALLLIPSTWHARRTRLYKSTQYISRPQLVRLGPKMRTFTPRWSDYPTDSTDHFVSGIHRKTYWKYGEEGAKEHVVTKGYGSGAVKFVADDRLWVVAVDRDYQTEWKLLQFIRTKSAVGGRAFADLDYSRFFPNNQSGFESVLRELQFRSGKTISRIGTQIGQQLQ